MPISFANVGLTPLHEHHELAAQFWHAHRINEFDHQTFFVPSIQQFPTPYPPQREPPALGRLHWPTGADQWSTCHLVATGAQVSQLRSIIGTTPTAQTLLITDGTTAGTIETEMYLLPPRPICQKGSDEWFLLTFVDSRFWWHQCGSAEIPDPPGTWSEFLEALFALLGESPLIDVIPSEYLEPNALRWTTGIQPIPIVIECVCKQIGMKTVRNLDGTVEVVTASSAQASDESRWTAIQNLVLNGGRLTGADIGRMAPSSVDVIFFDGNTGTSTPVNVTLASLGLSGYEGVEGVSAGIGRITADPLTTTALQQTAYALQAATDYYNWLLGLTDATLRGIVNINPEGLDDFVEWVHHPDMLVTRILRSQWADRNIYGELGANFPNPNWIPGGGSGGSGGSGSGSGSGSGNDGCTAAVNPVSVECEEGERVLRSTVLAVGLNSDGQFVLSQCETLDYPLGPCSPVDPNGTTLSAVVMVCPIYATCLSLDASHELLPEDWLIDVEGGNTITLPSSETAGEGCWFVITNTGGGTVTIEAQGGQTINGEASIELTDDFSSALVFLSCSDTTDWTAAILSGTPSGSGTVESITLTTANGMQVSGGTTQTITTTGTFALTLPFTLAGSGTLTNSGTSSVSGANTGDQFTSETASTLIGRGSAGGSGAAQEISLGSGLAMTGTTLSATGSGGTVTSVSVVTANGVSGSVATATTTPAITLTLAAITPSSVNGITLSGSGSIANSGTSSLTGFTGSGASSNTNTGDQNLFSSVVVSGQTTVTVNSVTTALTLVAGTGITLTTDNTAKSVTITGTGGTVTSVTGTTNQVSVATGTTTPVISLAGPHNFTTQTIHGILLGQTTGAITATAAMSDGQLLVGQTSADPLPKTLSGDATLAATGAITLKNTGTAGTYGQVTTDAQGRVTAGATCDVAHGGTGATTLTIHGVLLGQTTGAVVATAAMTDGQLLVGQSSADPLPKTMSGDATLAASGAIEVAGTLLGASVVATSQSTSSTTNTNLTTVQSVTLTLPTACRIIVELGATASHDTVNGSARLVIDLDGSDTDGPTCRCTAATLLFPCTGGAVDLGTVSSGSHTFTMQFRTNTGTVTFEKRSMLIYRCPP